MGGRRMRATLTAREYTTAYLPMPRARETSAARPYARFAVTIQQNAITMKQDPRFPNLSILDHPLIQHKLTHMRDKDTSTRTFRELLREITLLMGYEITRNLPITTKRVATPLVEVDAPVIAGRKLAIVPVLRAGIGMSDGLLELIPSARVGHIGVYRDDAHRPVEYLVRLPDLEDRIF